MSDIPNDLQYSKTHEWLRIEGADTYVVGITDYAQQALGDLVFVELPEVNTEVKAGEEVVVVESVKTASDIYAPISGEIIEVNQTLTENPSFVNQAPYGEGWLFKIKIKVKDTDELTALLNSESYFNQLSEN